MHMADALISAATGGAMYAAGGVSVAYSAVKFKRDERFEKKIPLTAVSGAFVFAAQMINFAIPGTGSSGHIGGGVLLAAVLGGPAAMLALTSVLIIQCLFFADGGLLALGCNIVNLAVAPCLIVHPLLFKPIVKTKMSASAITAASFVSSVAALQLGAFGVVLMTTASGVAGLPFKTFVLLMQPIHLAIGFIEGAVTAAVLCFINKTRPEILSDANGAPKKNDYKLKKILIAAALTALIIGGVFSVFSSAKPDGLEWAVIKTAKGESVTGGAAAERASELQDAIAIMPDYAFKNERDGAPAGTSQAGVAGGALTFALAGGTGMLISMIKRAGRRRRADPAGGS